MTDIEALDQIIQRLPMLRENGVTQLKVGEIEMDIRPKVEPLPKPNEPAEQQRNPADYGLRPGTQMPRTFAQRRTQAQVK